MSVPRGTYRGEYSFLPAGRARYQATGEFRAPRKGEYYLSGAIITAYRAPNDLTQSFWIAEQVTNDESAFYRLNEIKPGKKVSK